MKQIFTRKLRASTIPVVRIIMRHVLLQDSVSHSLVRLVMMAFLSPCISIFIDRKCILSLGWSLRAEHSVPHERTVGILYMEEYSNCVRLFSRTSAARLALNFNSRLCCLRSTFFSPPNQALRLRRSRMFFL